MRMYTNTTYDISKYLGSFMEVNTNDILVSCIAITDKLSKEEALAKLPHCTWNSVSRYKYCVKHSLKGKYFEVSADLAAAVTKELSDTDDDIKAIKSMYISVSKRIRR